jgi:hypothetical protein
MKIHFQAPSPHTTLTSLLAHAPERLGRGVPLLTVETEVNGDSKSTNERGPSLVDPLSLSCQYKIFCSALTALGCPVLNIFFLTVHYFKSFVPIAQ